MKSFNFNIIKGTLFTLLGIFIFNNGYCYNDRDTNLRYIVDRNGYHYYRGSSAPDRTYEAPYYNNTGYYTYANPVEGRLSYYKGYDRYNNGYYKGGFYGNEYYHNGHFNNGFYNPGNCAKRSACRYFGGGLLPGGK